MRSTSCDRRGERGFTLIEVIAATLILLVGILATTAMLNASSRANATNRQRDAATNMARELIESARAIPYERISEPGVNAVLQAIPGLEDSPGGAYTLVRNNVTYTVDVDVCIMDDPKDGGGPRSTTETFCANSAAPGTEDKNPEDYKRVTTTVSWTREGRERRVEQTGIINNPGSASGPAIRSIAPVNPAGTTVTANVTQIVVDVTTSSKPAAINWLLDGSVQQPPPVQQGTSGLNWRFAWQIGTTLTKTSGTLDGPYILSAEAFNQYGVSGPGRQETVVLNRRQPFDVERVTGGRTVFSTVEIEWNANSERDIVGYEVVRYDATGPVVICPLATQGLETDCTDPEPPATDPLAYKVFAYDRDPAGNVRRGDDMLVPLIVTAGNQPPFPPTGLEAARNPDGSVTLSWSRPSPEDPDGPSDGVAFYRVYRGGQELQNRLERWFDNRPNVTWQDTETDGLEHTYWVTAVDQHHMESEFLGPVTK
jgi:prepilin-type N-terminal cleavage/methylation domain-containing protein